MHLVTVVIGLLFARTPIAAQSPWGIDAGAFAQHNTFSQTLELRNALGAGLDLRWWSPSGLALETSLQRASSSFREFNHEKGRFVGARSIVTQSFPLTTRTSARLVVGYAFNRFEGLVHTTDQGISSLAGITARYSRQVSFEADIVGDAMWAATN